MTTSTIYSDKQYSQAIKSIITDISASPGKVSEAGICRLANQCGFEIFQDTIPGGKRISLGGTIVLIDLDFIDGRISNCAVSFASNIKENNDHSFMNNTSQEPSTVIFKSLQRRRLDKFKKTLQFLADGDKLSSSIDCFRILDEISHALFVVYDTVKPADTVKPSELAYSVGYGQPMINANETLGFGIWYWTKQKYVNSLNPRYYAYLGFRPVPTTGFVGISKYAVKYTQDWLIDAEKDTWNDPEPLEDARAELVLNLDPPIAIPEHLAEKWNAVISSKDKLNLNKQWEKSKTSIYVPQENDEEPIEWIINFSCGNVLPYLFVEINQIPLQHPKQIKTILDSLRNYILIRQLWDGAVSPKYSLNSSNLTEESIDQTMSLIDYMMEYDDLEKKTSFNHNIQASISMTMNSSNQIEFSFRVIDNINDNGTVKIVCGSINDGKHPSFHINTTDNKLQHIIPQLMKSLNITEDLRIIAVLISRCLEG